MKYHTALSAGHAINAPAVSRIQIGESVALVNDLFDGLPPEFDACDLLYAELPWVGGFQIFEERAGYEGRRYHAFMDAVSNITLDAKVPVIWVTGGHAARYLPTPRHCLPVTLNGQPGPLAFIYRTDLRDLTSAEELLTMLATRFECIGDPCCGYGRSARVFHDAGKRFVVADHNAQCIGVIAQEKW